MENLAKYQRQQAIPELKALFRKTIYGWSNKPDFGWSQIKTPNEVLLRVYATGPNADIYNLVSSGSPRHRIPNTGFTSLRFRPGYRPATTPGYLQSRRAYRSGKYQFSKYVEHPGFAPRNFWSLIGEAYADQFGIVMQAALTEIARK